MGAHGGPNMVEDGMVFGYDTGNSKSYAGEPATNSQDPDYAAFTQAGFDAWGCYDGSSSHTWDVNQSKTFVNLTGPDGNLTNAMLYHNFTGGFHGPTHWSGVSASLLTNGSKITVQGWVKAADAASVGKTVTPYLYYNKVGGGSYSTGTGYTLTANWQLVSHSYTVPEGSTGTGIMYFFTSGGTNIKMYLTKTAIVGGKLHAIQWLPGGTTRSATEGLIDFKDSTTIDLSNVSFDSDAQMAFDGTTDYVTVTHNSAHSFTGDFSIEIVFKPTGNTANCLIQKGSGNDYFQEYWVMCDTRNNNRQFELIMGQVGNTSANYQVNASNSVTIGQYHHIVTGVEGSTGFIYVNGELIDTGAVTDRIQSTSDIRIGERVDGFADSLGEQPITKIYNRALSAEEVQNNFNGIRNRFGI
jgi:hypothetical protein